MRSIINKPAERLLPLLMALTMFMAVPLTASADDMAVWDMTPADDGSIQCSAETNLALGVNKLEVIYTAGTGAPEVKVKTGSGDITAVKGYSVMQRDVSALKTNETLSMRIVYIEDSVADGTAVITVKAQPGTKEIMLVSAQADKSYRMIKDDYRTAGNVVAYGIAGNSAFTADTLVAEASADTVDKKDETDIKGEKDEDENPWYSRIALLCVLAVIMAGTVILYRAMKKKNEKKASEELRMNKVEQRNRAYRQKMKARENEVLDHIVHDLDYTDEVRPRAEFSGRDEIHGTGRKKPVRDDTPQERAGIQPAAGKAKPAVLKPHPVHADARRARSARSKPVSVPKWATPVDNGTR